MELGMELFVKRVPRIHKIRVWSSLIKLADAEELLSEKTIASCDMIHAAVSSFYERIAEYNLHNPRPPTNKKERGTELLSIAYWHNEKLLKSIAINLLKSTVITELTICGMNLSVKAAERLNKGLLSSSNCKKLRLNFCITNRSVLKALMPALCQPDKLPLQELSLAANALTDVECGELVAKIVISHGEARDEVFWVYGLRNELPPYEEIKGIKKLDISCNKLGDLTATKIARALKTDTFMR
jgi:hypothetical protein